MRDTPTPGGGDAAAPRIGGRYRLGEAIGRGGMSTVYRAHDEQLDRPVALKRLRAEPDDQHRFAARFAGEARRAASIGHPNVVALYDVGEDDEAPYLVMELVEDGDLAALLRREGRLAPERAARLAADAAAGLQAAHDAGVTHRDVKPGNILIGPDGRAMVTDFGIARATGEDTLTRTGAVLGSVDYFSPEQTRGERAGPTSDIYALGVVLYELVTGKRPFRGDTPYATAVDRLNRPPPDPRAVQPDVPDGLAEIATRAMALLPEDRFPTPEAMRAALLAWADRHAAPPPVPSKAVRTRPSAAAEPPGPVSIGAAAARAPAARAWAIGALLLALLLGGYVGGRLIAGDDVGEVLPEVIVGSPGGFAVNDPTLTPDPAAAPSEDLSTPALTPAPSAAPPAPQPTIAPTAPPATPAPVAVAGPDDAVAAFYRHVVAERFDEAYALWSNRMKATYPRETNLDGRFDDTESITFDALFVADQGGNDATVQANFTERYEGGSSRQFIGYWRLIRVDERWLLDEPTY